MTGTDLKQRLAAILAADAAGHSRLISVDERGTVAAFDAAQAVFCKPVRSNHGRVIDMAEDAVLPVFEPAAGGVSGQVGMTIDLTASILAATETPVPPQARLEGIDLFPVMEGRAAMIEQTLFWCVWGRPSTAALRPQWAVRSGDWKLLIDGHRPLRVDVRVDLAERNNRIAQHPDIARRLNALLQAWQIHVDAEAKVAAPR